MSARRAPGPRAAGLAVEVRRAPVRGVTRLEVSAGPAPVCRAAGRGGWRSAALAVLAIAGLSGVPACRRAGTTPLSAPPPRTAGPAVALPDGGMAHSEPLARVTWSGAWARACGGRRTDGTAGPTEKREGPCRVQAAAGAPGPEPASAAFDAAGAASIDAPAPCRVFYQDIPGDPGAPPARATLIGPSARQPLDSWSVPREVDGDYFAVEAAFSPDGRWLALVHTAVGLGEGERLVRVEGLEVRPAPTCR